MVEWRRKDHELPKKSKISTKVLLPLGITTSTLVISNVTNEDTGHYYCSVWNKGKGAQSNSANLLLAGLFFLL